MKIATGIVVAFVLYIVGYVNIAEAAFGYANYKNEAHPGKCAVTDTIIISPGEEADYPDGCGIVHCQDADGASTVATCGNEAPSDNCEWGDAIDAAAKYPECCKRKEICK